MVRINLLPPEIIERRKYERFYPYAFITGGIMLLVIVVTWGGMQFIVGSRADALQQTQETTRQLTEQAQALSVFELRETEFAARQEAANSALAGRVNMGGIAEDVSLVLPEEVWVERLFVHEDTGVSLVGMTPNSDDQSMREGYKSVAATLVRLSAIDRLKDVWLTGARTTVMTQQGSDGKWPVVTFESTAQLIKDEAPAAAASADQPQVQ